MPKNGGQLVYPVGRILDSVPSNASTPSLMFPPVTGLPVRKRRLITGGIACLVRVPFEIPFSIRVQMMCRFHCMISVALRL
jgi:hypothetical protein